MPEEEYGALEKQALAIPLSAVLHGLDTLQDALERMGRGADRRTEMEMAVIRLCSPELDVSPSALLRRIEALEQGRAAPARRPRRLRKLPHREGQTPAPDSPAPPARHAPEKSAAPGKGRACRFFGGAGPERCPTGGLAGDPCGL